MNYSKVVAPSTPPQRVQTRSWAMRKLADGVVPRVVLDMTREFDMIREFFLHRC